MADLATITKLLLDIEQKPVSTPQAESVKRSAALVAAQSLPVPKK